MLSSSADLARTLVGILANLTTFILFISPTPTFIRIWKKGSVEQFSPDPYLVKFINFLFTPDSILVVTVNGTGVLIELVFTTLFIMYSHGRSKRLKVLLLAVLLLAVLELVFVAIFAVLVLTLANSHKLRSIFVGPMCILFSMMTYASPLSIMIPNGMGALLGTVQLILYATYYKSTKQQLAGRREPLLLTTEAEP